MSPRFVNTAALQETIEKVLNVVNLFPFGQGDLILETALKVYRLEREARGLPRSEKESPIEDLFRIFLKPAQGESFDFQFSHRLEFLLAEEANYIELKAILERFAQGVEAARQRALQGAG